MILEDCLGSDDDDGSTDCSKVEGLRGELLEWDWWLLL